jgi:broad specificity phosphatase PhoE
MPKKKLHERRAARAARKTAPPGAQPDAADISQIPPIAPEESARLASEGQDINRGSSTRAPLSSVGKKEVQDVAAKLANKGGLDELQTSPALRTQQTADAIVDNNPTPLPVSENPNLESWAQGNLEGQPLVAVKKQIQDLIRNQPGRMIPGQGQMSSRAGESFDAYRMRALPAVRGLMQELANDPTKKIGVPDHSSVTKLAKAWVANGTPDDFSIKPSAMDAEPAKPGSVSRLFPDQDGNWELKDVDLNSSDPLPPGIFFIRHGATPWNKETYQKQDDSHNSMAQIAKTVGAMDFGRARAAAQKAAKDGGLTDDQIDSIIDSSLPSAQDAANLPLHHLLAVATAASPAKRKEYAPLLQSIKGAQGVDPQGMQKINDHINSLGIGDDSQQPEAV